MSPLHIAAYNTGVRVALAQARLTAQAIAAMPGFKPTRQGYAVEALQAFADAGTALLKVSTSQHNSGEAP